MVTLIGAGSSGLNVYATWILSKWSSESENKDVNSWRYLGFYSLALASGALCMLMQALIWVPSHCRAIKSVHQTALWSVLRAPIEYFDTTVKGRIINRFSSDQQKVDMQLHGILGLVLATTFSATSAIIAIVLASPWMFIALVPLGWVYILSMNFYRASMRELQRLASVGMSPVYESFSELLNGIATIRAYGEGSSHEQRNMDLLLNYLQPQYYQNVTNEWLSIRLELIGGILVGAVSMLSVVQPSIYGDPGSQSASSTLGFALTYAMSITVQLSGFVMAFTNCEATLVSMERILALRELQPEAPLVMPDDPPATEWPRDGSIRFESVRMRYRAGTPLVLKGLSFAMRPGERVGVCGRTGAGKSSLLAALFRLVEIEGGVVYIDSVDISTLGVSTLRKRISIIPQDPVLFSGTLRSNLDPAGQIPSERLWGMIDTVGLRSVVEERASGLDMSLESNGRSTKFLL